MLGSEFESVEGLHGLEIKAFESPMAFVVDLGRNILHKILIGNLLIGNLMPRGPTA